MATELRLNIDVRLAQSSLTKMQMKRCMTEKGVKKIVRTELISAKKEVQKVAKAMFEHDDQHAYKAVSAKVYKKTLGGNLNILDNSKNTYTRSIYKPKPQPEYRRGGNRAKASRDTIRARNYYGASRGYILRFMNSGTKIRTVKGKMFKGANRGSIGRSTGWFNRSAEMQLNKAAERIGDGVVDEIVNKHNKG